MTATNELPPLFGWPDRERLAYVRKWHARRGRVPRVEEYPWLAPVFRRWREGQCDMAGQLGEGTEA
jgi:hypothetical protein